MSEQYATYKFTLPQMNGCPKPSDVDKWVPGSQSAAMSCSQAIGACGPDPFFQNFAYNKDQPFSSTCRPNAGLGGGCQSLVAPERAQTWENVLKPQLKARLEKKQRGLGFLDGEPATAICSVKDSAINQCVGLCGPSCYVPPNPNSWMKANWRDISN